MKIGGGLAFVDVEGVVRDGACFNRSKAFLTGTPYSTSSRSSWSMWVFTSPSAGLALLEAWDDTLVFMHSVRYSDKVHRSQFYVYKTLVLTESNW